MAILWTILFNDLVQVSIADESKIQRLVGNHFDEFVKKPNSYSWKNGNSIYGPEERSNDNRVSPEGTTSTKLTADDQLSNKRTETAIEKQHIQINPSQSYRKLRISIRKDNIEGNNIVLKTESFNYHGENKANVFPFTTQAASNLTSYGNINIPRETSVEIASSENSESRSEQIPKIDNFVASKTSPYELRGNSRTSNYAANVINSLSLVGNSTVSRSKSGTRKTQSIANDRSISRFKSHGHFRQQANIMSDSLRSSNYTVNHKLVEKIDRSSKHKYRCFSLLCTRRRRSILSISKVSSEASDDRSNKRRNFNGVRTGNAKHNVGDLSTKKQSRIHDSKNFLDASFSVETRNTRKQKLDSVTIHPETGAALLISVGWNSSNHGLASNKVSLKSVEKLSRNRILNYSSTGISKDIKSKDLQYSLIRYSLDYPSSPILRSTRSVMKPNDRQQPQVKKMNYSENVKTKRRSHFASCSRNGWSRINSARATFVSENNATENEVAGRYRRSGDTRNKKILQFADVRDRMKERLDDREFVDKTVKPAIATKRKIHESVVKIAFTSLQTEQRDHKSIIKRDLAIERTSLEDGETRKRLPKLKKQVQKLVSEMDPVENDGTLAMNASRLMALENSEAVSSPVELQRENDVLNSISSVTPKRTRKMEFFKSERDDTRESRKIKTVGKNVIFLKGTILPLASPGLLPVVAKIVKSHARGNADIKENVAGFNEKIDQRVATDTPSSMDFPFPQALPRDFRGDDKDEDHDCNTGKGANEILDSQRCHDQQKRALFKKNVVKNRQTDLSDRYGSRDIRSKLVTVLTSHESAGTDSTEVKYEIENDANSSSRNLSDFTKRFVPIKLNDRTDGIIRVIQRDTLVGEKNENKIYDQSKDKLTRRMKNIRQVKIEKKNSVPTVNSLQLRDSTNVMNDSPLIQLKTDTRIDDKTNDVQLCASCKILATVGNTKQEHDLNGVGKGKVDSDRNLNSTNNIASFINNYQQFRSTSLPGTSNPNENIANSVFTDSVESSLAVPPAELTVIDNSVSEAHVAKTRVDDGPVTFRLPHYRKNENIQIGLSSATNVESRVPEFYSTPRKKTPNAENQRPSASRFIENVVNVRNLSLKILNNTDIFPRDYGKSRLHAGFQYEGQNINGRRRKSVDHDTKMESSTSLTKTDITSTSIDRLPYHDRSATADKQLRHSDLEVSSVTPQDYAPRKSAGAKEIEIEFTSVNRISNDMIEAFKNSSTGYWSSVTDTNIGSTEGDVKTYGSSTAYPPIVETANSSQTDKTVSQKITPIRFAALSNVNLGMADLANYKSALLKSLEHGKSSGATVGVSVSLQEPQSNQPYENAGIVLVTGDTQTINHTEHDNSTRLTAMLNQWPVKHSAVVEGDLVLGGLMMVHEREDSITCGPVMPQGGVQALEAMLYTLDWLNQRNLVPGVKIGAHILDDCDKDTYGLEMAVDFIKGKVFR